MRANSKYFVLPRAYWFTVLFGLLLTTSMTSVWSNDLVKVNSNSFEQLITSSTMRWERGGSAEGAMTIGGGEDGNEGQIICRISHLGLKAIGLLSPTKDSCKASLHDGSSTMISSSKYETLTSSAARLIWVPWTTPNLPPTGAVALSDKQNRFIATNSNHTLIGYLDPKVGNNGAIIFPKHPTSPVPTTGEVLTEIEPERYELFEIQFKHDLGYVNEEVILAQGHLTYDLPFSKYTSPDEFDHLPGGIGYTSEEHEYRAVPEVSIQANTKGRIESVLTYDLLESDNWGSGTLMAKTLPTTITLPHGWTPLENVTEWGIPWGKRRTGETVTASYDLWPGTAVNMTLKGDRKNGGLIYWATLRTHYKDGFSSTRGIVGVRTILQTTNIRLEYDRPYFIANGTYVPEPTTTTTTTTSTTSRSTTVSTTVPVKINKSRGTSEGGNEKEKMFGDQQSTETLTFSASSKLSGNAVARVTVNLGIVLGTLLTLTVLNY